MNLGEPGGQVCFDVLNKCLGWFERNWASKGGALLGGVALLEEVCHCGLGFEVFYAQAVPNVAHSSLSVAC